MSHPRDSSTFMFFLRISPPTQANAVIPRKYYILARSQTQAMCFQKRFSNACWAQPALHMAVGKLPKPCTSAILSWWLHLGALLLSPALRDVFTAARAHSNCTAVIVSRWTWLRPKQLCPTNPVLSETWTAETKINKTKDRNWSSLIRESFLSFRSGSGSYWNSANTKH